MLCQILPCQDQSWNIAVKSKASYISMDQYMQYFSFAILTNGKDETVNLTTIHYTDACM